VYNIELKTEGFTVCKVDQIAGPVLISRHTRVNELKIITN